MPFNDIYRLRIYCRLHGALVNNVLHFVQEDPLPTVDAQFLANDFVTNMYTPLRQRATNQMNFDFVEVQTIVPFSGGPVTANFPAGGNGSQAIQSVSATLAEVISIYTSRGGRRGKGRIYLAGAPTNAGSDIGSGTWLSGQTARTQTLATAIAARYMAHTTATNFSLGVWSRAEGPLHPPWSSSQFVRATALTVRTTVRTQRRRQVGVGR
jgi:hypothetical protein